MKKLERESMKMTNSPEKLGRVAVLMGGLSAERPVSMKSGKAVLDAAIGAGIDAFGFDLTKDSVESLMTLEADRVFIALHGKYGEDGAVQGLLDLRDIPYTGSGVLGSAIGMDKVRTKQLWQAYGLPTPPFLVCEASADLREVSSLIGYPLIVKPVSEGSSIGIRKVTDSSQVEEAVACAFRYDKKILLESYVQGREFTAAILDNRVLPLIELKSANDIYDYAAKYELDSTQYLCPPNITDEQSKEWAEICEKAFFAVDAQGWGRVDFMVDEDGKPWLLEVNTSPGMTDHSLVPMAAKEAGMDFSELVLRILMNTLESEQRT